jgi:oxygen-dependent protoporphyrinogen oxidase
MRASMRERARAAGGGGGRGEAPSAFVSLRGGVGELARALVERSQREGITLKTGARVTHLERTPAGGWLVRVDHGASWTADAVLLAAPAHATSGLLQSLDPGVAEALASIPYGSTATVFLGYRRADVAHPMDGVGFVVPRSLGRPILAGTWVSSKWRQRVPDGHVLLRAFFGGAWGEGVLDRSDAALVELAREELGRLMDLHAEPVVTRVFRFERATAQMRVGHLAKMRWIKSRLAEVAPAILIAGGGYDGAGIPDCVRQARDASAELAGMQRHAERTQPLTA